VTRMTAAVLALLLLAQIPGPNEALGWAIAHSVEQPADVRPFYRYVWISPDSVPQREACGLEAGVSECVLANAVQPFGKSE
jgi:hypothetical protein